MTQISVIIATKNEAKNIKRLLLSLRRQTFKNFEAIIVDNYSTDNTLKIAKKFTQKVFTIGPERSAQRNFGVSRAKGTYILFLDADMKLQPNVLKECLRLMNDNHQIAGVIIDEIASGTGFLSKIKALEKEIYRGEELIEAARFFRLEDVKKIGGYDENLIAGEDWDLSQRMRIFGSFGRIESKILHFEEQTLFEDMRKKFYYAKNLSRYEKKIPYLWQTKQGNYFYRTIILFKKPDLILKNPLEFICLIFLKTAQFASFLLAKYL